MRPWAEDAIECMHTFNCTEINLHMRAHMYLRFPYPYVVVPELTPPDCTKDKYTCPHSAVARIFCCAIFAVTPRNCALPGRPATNWNSTLFDGIVRDFMAAVCGCVSEYGGCNVGWFCRYVSAYVQEKAWLGGWG